MSFYRLLLCLALIVPCMAHAQSINVSLTNENGEAVSGAVVSFTPLEPNPELSTSGSAHSINQKDVAFDPFISLVPVNSNVTFQNEDSVLHHVFSFSKAKRFNLKLFGASEPQDVLFDTPGIVSVGCNIHDGMVAYIFVSDSPFASQTDESGAAVLDGLPEGEGILTVWHPLMKGKGNTIRRDITVTADLAPITMSAKFRRGANAGGNY